MEAENNFDAGYKGRPDPRSMADYSNSELDPVSRTDDDSPRQTDQAERGVMHPDRDEVEWRYWRGGWGRLTE
jgi:hypothetical protein